MRIMKCTVEKLAQIAECMFWAFMFVIGLMAILMEFPPAAEAWAYLENLGGRFEVDVTILNELYLANKKYLLAEGCIFLAVLLFKDFVIKIWKAVWNAFFRWSEGRSSCPVRGIRYYFIEKRKIKRDGTAVSDIIHAPVGGKIENLANEGAHGRAFAEGLSISVNDGACSVNVDGNTVPIYQGYKHFKTADGTVYLRTLSDIYSEPKGSQSFHLRAPRAFCKTHDSCWIEVAPEKQLWRAAIGGKETYFHVVREGMSWKAVPYKVDDVEVLKVQVVRKSDRKNTRTDYPEILELKVKRNEKVHTVELRYDERYYENDIENGHMSRIEPDSDRYPWIMAACFGPVSSGKTSWISALTTQKASRNLKRLLDVSYVGPELEAKAVRTNLQSQRVISLALQKGRERIGTLYLLDLAGELTRSGVNKKTEQNRVIESIARLSDAVLEFSDDTVIYEENETERGETANVYELLQNARKRGLRDLEFICICCKADLLKERCKMNAPVKMHYDSGTAIPILTADHPVFDSVAGLVENSGQSANVLTYRHIAAAKQIYRDTNILRSDDDKCFIVSAGTEVETDADADEMVLNRDNQVNAELPLAYLIQTKFGIGLRKGEDF